MLKNLKQSLNEAKFRHNKGYKYELSVWAKGISRGRFGVNPEYLYEVDTCEVDVNWHDWSWGLELTDKNRCSTYFSDDFNLNTTKGYIIDFKKVFYNELYNNVGEIVK